jgi:hypothetical protein
VKVPRARVARMAVRPEMVSKTSNVSQVTNNDLCTQPVDSSVDERWMPRGWLAGTIVRPQRDLGPSPRRTQLVHPRPNPLSCKDAAFPQCPPRLLQRLPLRLINDNSPATEGWGQALEDRE